MTEDDHYEGFEEPIGVGTWVVLSVVSTISMAFGVAIGLMF